MKLYSISDEYIKYLRKKFPRVYSNKENVRIHKRKYLGVVIEIGSHKYYIPLSSPKDNAHTNATTINITASIVQITIITFLPFILSLLSIFNIC